MWRLGLEPFGTAETNKGLAKVLKPEQMKRYRQIQLQQLGLMAFRSQLWGEGRL